ncbi:MAG: PLP-dependent aspartate aminotransferase family protein [Planctomycetota bacterium]|jgi:cystathionine beta-lyase|nr:PLP-dependent aspartate aminotransferase family protein [Planctomycetota bacterium]
MDINTRIVHAGIDRDPATGASSVPLYQASTYSQNDPERHGRYDYVRSGNPTREALEKALAELEGGAAGLAFASGMAATSSALLLFRPGDHLVVGRDVYGGTFRVLDRLFSRWGLRTTFVDTTDAANIRAAVEPATRAIFIETPSNPFLRITDLAATAAIARERGLLTIADGTFTTPYLQRPLEHGFDLVVHSATKFLNGHSDLLAGAVVARGAELGDRLKFIQNAFGAVLGVQDSWLLLRGLKTLAARLETGQKTAHWLAERLAALPEVKKVHYPGLPGHPGREIHARQASGGGAVLSFELAEEGMTMEFLRRLRLPLLAVSLGGVETIVTHPATMSHASMPPEERELRGISEGLVRMSVGLESGEDLLTDILQAFREAGRKRG